MRLPFALPFHLAAIVLLLATASATAQEFIRGDANVDGVQDISDPIGLDVNGYSLCAGEIEQGLEKILEGF